MPEIVHHKRTGLLVPPRDPGALADAILLLEQKAALRDQVARQGYELATTQYSWGAIAQRTQSFYEQVLAEGSLR